MSNFVIVSHGDLIKNYLKDMGFFMLKIVYSKWKQRQIMNNYDQKWF